MASSPPRMPPFNRFASSKYRNQLLEPGNSEKQFTELPRITSSTNARTIACGHQFLAVSLGTSPSPWSKVMVGTSVGLIDWSEPGKYSGNVRKTEFGGAIADLAWSDVEKDVLGVASPSGVSPSTEEADCRVKLLNWTEKK